MPTLACIKEEYVHQSIGRVTKDKGNPFSSAEIQYLWLPLVFSYIPSWNFPSKLLLLSMYPSRSKFFTVGENFTVFLSFSGFHFSSSSSSFSFLLLFILFGVYNMEAYRKKSGTENWIIGKQVLTWTWI